MRGDSGDLRDIRSRSHGRSHGPDARRPYVARPAQGVKTVIEERCSRSVGIGGPETYGSFSAHSATVSLSPIGSFSFGVWGRRTSIVRFLRRRGVLERGERGRSVFCTGWFESVFGNLGLRGDRLSHTDISCYLWLVTEQVDKACGVIKIRLPTFVER